jgi:hypothetical protein
MSSAGGKRNPLCLSFEKEVKPFLKLGRKIHDRPI